MPFCIHDFDSYAGMFQNTHGAAITTTTAVLILLAFLKKKSSIIQFKILNYALFLFGIYLIYFTFIRTGYAMFFVGLVLIYMPKKFSIKQIVTASLAYFRLDFGILLFVGNERIFL